MTTNDRDNLFQLIRDAARIQDRGLLEGRDLDRIAHLATERIYEAGWRPPLTQDVFTDAYRTAEGICDGSLNPLST